MAFVLVEASIGCILASEHCSIELASTTMASKFLNVIWGLGDFALESQETLNPESLNPEP